ncbi:MAG: rod shape-determining protein RodA [Bacteriovoracia bacterium]
MKAQILAFLKRYDFTFFSTILVIFGIGLLNLYSATHANPSAHMANLFKTQTMWFSLAVAAGGIVSFIGPKNLFRYSYFIYAFNIFLLILVLIMGKKALGAQRWIAIGPFNLQPSETMKIALVLALSRWYSLHNPESPLDIKKLIVPSLIVFIPAVLVIMEPDLGTGLLLLLIFGAMTFYRRLKWKSIFILCILGILGGTFMYNFGLKEYQRKRISTFLDPHRDAKGSGYNAIQSEIAIGSGRILGKGYKKSSQASLQYLPENHTDFVFSIFNEEHGLIGSIFLLLLYLILFLRMLWLSGVVLRIYDSLLAVGIMSILFWHTFINMCMVMGLSPIVGLPLPFMSYGGSSLLTFGICIGIVTSLSNSRNMF